MKNFVKASMAGLMMFVCAPAFAETQGAAPVAATADPARIAAARELMEVTGVSRQLDGMLNAIKQNAAKGAATGGGEEASKKVAAAFEEATKKFLSYKEDMINDFAALYAKTFTAEEMKTVTEFYKSGPGAKFITMMPQVMQEGGAIGIKYSQRVLEDIKASNAGAADKK